MTEPKIKMAIWIMNKLIDKYPEIYVNLKKEYEKQKNKEKR